jgi:hypothetical protein
VVNAAKADQKNEKAKKGAAAEQPKKVTAAPNNAKRAPTVKKDAKPKKATQ